MAGTLSRQIAHVMYLGDESQSVRISLWTPHYLTAEVIPWLKHVDLIWPALSKEEQTKTAADVEQLYRPPDNIGRCLEAVLGRVICNPHSPHQLRITAIQHYPQQSIGCLVSKHLYPARLLHALSSIATLQLSPSLPSDPLYYQSIAASLHIQNMPLSTIRHLFAPPSDILNNALLHTVTLPQCISGTDILQLFTDNVLLIPDINQKILSISRLLPCLVVNVCKSPMYINFARTYMLQLMQVNNRCQLDMLFGHCEDNNNNNNNKEEDVAGNEETIAGVIEQWTQLKRAVGSMADEYLQRDYRRFRRLLEKYPSNQISNAVEEIWMRIYLFNEHVVK